MPHPCRVLLVDDNTDAYQTVKDLLRSQREYHFELDWLMDGQSFLQQLPTFSQRYDVCLMDYNLGDYNGLELLQRAQAQESPIPFIMLTGHTDPTIDDEALSLGAADFLNKANLRASLLVRSIRYAIKQQQDKLQLLALYHQVQELEQLKSDMIRIAAHDLRNPLMVILNYAHFMGQEPHAPLTPNQQDYLATIIQNVQRMQAIINEILSLERVQMGNRDNFQAVDLSELVQMIYSELDPTEQPVRLSLSASEEPLWVLGDLSFLREAIDNLILNAIKYTPADKRVEIKVMPHNNHAEAHFTVCDEGYGIPLEQQAKLFQPFYRVKSKETRSIQGTGLGLYLVKTIIKRHGGEIIFESEYGKGSTFGFRLPLLSESEAHPAV
ncbi:MAG: ATP-binding protein [Phototrophicaceae bacterium]